MLAFCCDWLGRELLCGAMGVGPRLSSPSPLDPALHISGHVMQKVSVLLMRACPLARWLAWSLASSQLVSLCFALSAVEASLVRSFSSSPGVRD